MTISKLLLVAVVTLFLSGTNSAGAAVTLAGYISNDYDPSGFLAEIDDTYPCWYWLCQQAVLFRGEKQRHRFWFETTFYGEMDKAIVKRIERLACRYGIRL